MKTRLLRTEERPYASVEASLPIVIEAAGFRGAKALAARIKIDSATLKTLLYTHGAILFRGFDVATDADFAEIVTSLDGARPMSAYFMSEPGRHAIGTRGVFNTNSIYKTGGAFYLGGFHSENFYSTDVPSLQAFWCNEPPGLGGETALVQAASAYADLPLDLREKLEREPVLAGVFLLKSIAARYAIDEGRAEAFCRSVGLEVQDDGAEGKSVLVFKPAVLEHPHTGRRAIQINVSGEVDGFDAALRRHAAPSYVGWRWSLHRAAWRSQRLARLLPLLDSYPLLVDTLRASIDGLTTALRTTRKRRDPPPRGRLDERLTVVDVEAMARAVWQHTSVFTWKRGDVLLCDQLQLLHAGMPGRGPRDIRVMMCDPVRMDLPIRSGLLSPAVTERSYESMGARIARVADG